MKKKIVICVTFVAIIGFAVTLFSMNEKLSAFDIALENVEALSQKEEGNMETEDCYAYSVLSLITDCNTCEGQQTYDPIKKCVLLVWAVGDKNYIRKCYK